MILQYKIFVWITSQYFDTKNDNVCNTLQYTIKKKTVNCNKWKETKLTLQSLYSEWTLWNNPY